MGRTLEEITLEAIQAANGGTGETDTGPLIDSRRVEAIFQDCLFKDEEIKDGKPIEGTYIPAEGITCKVGFHPARLESYREEVKHMLEGLPLQFRSINPTRKALAIESSENGGGWSFREACNDRNGVQWTGFQQRMEQLFQLGIGLGLAKCLLPRELWGTLPGGMPYYSVL